ncbi:MAG: hypothetical protein EAY79_08725 [Runella slithyformis]|nr:MAG: hypothetical protein EAY79_08725 [Runella slithyformis]
MTNNKFRQLSIFVWIFALPLLGGGSCQSSFVYKQSKIKGVCTVAPNAPIDTAAFQPIRQTNAEWVAVVPYGFCRPNEPHFYFDNSQQWWGETSQGAAKTIAMAHQMGLKVMLKPHVWVAQGTYTGDFTLKTEAEWQIFEQDFGKYVLRNAQVADSMHVALFCIATEMDAFVRQRPQFWRNLIGQVRQIYKGPLTYADNWDKCHQNPIWADLDYVGIDAYFPLTNNKKPTPEDLQKGWQPHLQLLKKLAIETQKPILFTEFGYRSVEGAAVRPWEYHSEAATNLQQQADAYEVLFREVWQQEWFAGGFVWKWFLHAPTYRRNHEPDPYTPQGKPAEVVLKKWYGKK